MSSLCLFAPNNAKTSRTGKIQKKQLFGLVTIDAFHVSKYQKEYWGILDGCIFKAPMDHI